MDFTNFKDLITRYRKKEITRDNFISALAFEQYRQGISRLFFHSDIKKWVAV